MRNCACQFVHSQNELQNSSIGIIIREIVHPQQLFQPPPLLLIRFLGNFQLPYYFNPHLFRTKEYTNCGKHSLQCQNSDLQISKLAKEKYFLLKSKRRNFQIYQFANLFLSDSPTLFLILAPCIEGLI